MPTRQGASNSLLEMRRLRHLISRAGAKPSSALDMSSSMVNINAVVFSTVPGNHL
jgi:hypothetical protein